MIKGLKKQPKESKFSTYLREFLTSSSCLDVKSLISCKQLEILLVKQNPIEQKIILRLLDV